MKKLYWIIIMLLAFRVCDGQNLVPNGSFEVFDTCPDTEGQIFYAVPWHQATSGGTPDYFDSCSLGMNVPYALTGYQNAINGVAFVGLYAYVLYPNYYNVREYIQVELNDYLKNAHIYYVSFFVNLCNECGYSVDKLGAYLSNSTIYGNDSSYLPYIPQVESTSFLSDTANWMQINGYYLAQGGEKYITIGNFRSDTLTDTLHVNNVGWIFAYYFIDSVTVIDSTATGINEPNHQQSLTLFSNPFSDNLTITLNKKEPVELTLYDLTSRKLLHQQFTSSTTLHTSQLSKGIYIYEVRNKNGVIKKGKVVKD